MIKFKRTVAMLLASVMLGSAIGSAFPVVGSAAVVTNSYSEYVLTLQNRCREIEELLQRPVAGSTSALYQLQLLSEYYLASGFLIKFRDVLSVNDTELSYLQKTMKHYTENFNVMFSNKSDKLLKCELVADFDDLSASWKTIKYNLVKVIPEYLNTVVDEVTGTVVGNSDSEEMKAVIRNNRTVLSAVFVVHENISDVYEQLRQYTIYDGKDKTFVVKVDEQNLTEVLNEFEITHESILQAAETYVVQTGTNTNISVDLTRPLIENLGDIVEVNNKIQVDNDPTTSLLYKAYLASSSVYEPMKSYVGDSTFLASLDYVIGDTAVASDAKRLYNQIKDIRKPLYFRQYDDEGAPSGNASLFTIKEFVNYIQNSGSGSLCTIKGEFKYDAVSGQWIYDLTNTDTINTVGDTLESVEEIREDDSLENSGIIQESVDPKDLVTEEQPITTSEDTNNTSEEETENGFFDNLFGDNSEGSTILNFFLGKPAVATATEVNTPTASEEVETNEVGSLINAVTKDISFTDDATQIENNTGIVSSQTVTDEVTSISSAIYAIDVVTDETRMSDAVLMFGTRFARDVDNMTSVVLNNIFADTVATEKLLENGNDYLYINVFGDIVTAENLVILPAIANPIFYQYTEQGAQVNKDNPFSQNTQLIDTSDSIATGYYPFTVAFMNNYVTPLKHSSKFSLLNKTDIGKYLIVGVTEEDEEIVTTSLKAAELMSIDQIRSTAPLQCPPIVCNFSTKSTFSEKVLGVTRLIFGSSQQWTEDNGIYYYSPLVMTGALSINGVPIFPYSKNEDYNKEIAQTIALAAFYYLSTNCESANAEEAGRLNENYIIHNIIVSIATGTNNPSGFSKSQLLEYETYSKLASNRFLEMLTNVVSEAYDVISGSDGVIGLAESFHDPILGRLIGAFYDYWYMFVAVILLILLYFLAKSSISLTSGAATVASTMVGLWLFMMIIPNWIPSVFNWVITDVSSTFVYKVVAAKLEYYSDTTELWDVDRDGDQKFSNSSLTLYRASVSDYPEFLESLRANSLDLAGGKTITIDEEAGLFAEGDSIKINLNKMLSQLKISSTLITEDGKNYHKFNTVKTVSNNVDYYSPFYLFTDAFVEKLNKLAKVYEMPKLTDTYVNDTVKENYIVYSYVHSRPFVTPNDYTIEIPSDHQHMSDQEYEEYIENETLIMQELEAEFQSNIDFLGIADILYSPSDAMKKTLWYETMCKNGFYDGNGNPVEDKMNNLISYVNFQTKKFIYDMEDEIGMLSDDVMIKIIALRATIAFSHKCSNVGSMLYPFALDFSSLTLDDVIPMIFVEDYQQYLSKDMNVVDYVADNYGLINLILFAVLVFLMFVVTQIISIVIPVLYIVLGCLLLLKITRGGNLQTVVNGFVRVFVISMIAMTFISVLLSKLQTNSGEMKTLYLSLAVMIVISFVIASLVDSVVHNFTELGGEVSVKALLQKPLEVYKGVDFGYHRDNNFDRFEDLDVSNEFRNNQERPRSARFTGSRYGSDAAYFRDDYYDEDFSNTRERYHRRVRE